MSNKWRRTEIELTPQLLRKLFDYVKTPDADLDQVIYNLTWLSKSDETLTVEEYEHIIKKSSSM